MIRQAPIARINWKSAFKWKTKLKGKSLSLDMHSPEDILEILFKVVYLLNLEMIDRVGVVDTALAMQVRGPEWEPQNPGE